MQHQRQAYHADAYHRGQEQVEKQGCKMLRHQELTISINGLVLEYGVNSRAVPLSRSKPLHGSTDNAVSHGTEHMNVTWPDAGPCVRLSTR